MHATLAITNRDMLDDGAATVVESVSGDYRTLLRDGCAYLPGHLALIVAANKYQFFTRSKSDPKYRVLKARSLRTNVGFFNRYKPQVGPANLSVRSEARKAEITVTPGVRTVMELTGRPHQTTKLSVSWEGYATEPV